MEKKQKIIMILGGAASVCLLGGGIAEELIAEWYYSQYNSLYNTEWNKIYTVWKNSVYFSSLRTQYPTYLSLKDAFNTSFIQNYGYMLNDAAQYQFYSNILFELGAVATAIFIYIIYKYRKQSKLAVAQVEVK